MGCPAGTHNDLKLPQIDLLSPLAIRGVTLRSRIGMSPMCQQSVVLARELKQRGVDAIDVSSGGLAPTKSRRSPWAGVTRCRAPGASGTRRRS